MLWCYGGVRRDYGGTWMFGEIMAGWIRPEERSTASVGGALRRMTLRASIHDRDTRALRSRCRSAFS